MKRYSEHNEDEFMDRYFKDVNAGFFVDIGANDGVKGSNTRKLYDKGWTGVCVEPATDSFAGLVNNYANQNRVRIVHGAVTDVSGPITFYQHKKLELCGLNSAHKRWADLFDPGTWDELTVQSFRLRDLGLPESFDFLSVDTEGGDLTILQQLDATISPRLICAEMDKFDYGQKIHECLNAKGYKHLLDVESNGFFERV